MEIINSWLKTYLIGPMEDTALKDEGRGWRDKIRPLLENRVDKNNNKIYIFDPTLEEQSKVGLPPKEFHQKMHGWINAGHNELVKEGADLIWRGKTYIKESKDKGKAELIKIMGDIDYVVNSDFLICRMEENDKPCGTFFEAGIALEHNIPIYVIQTMNREKYPQSFVGAVFATNGHFFESQNKLLEFLDKKYNLKEKK